MSETAAIRLHAITAKIDELERQQAEAKQWGAAVGARHEWLGGLYMEKHRLEAELNSKPSLERNDRD